MRAALRCLSCLAVLIGAVLCVSPALAAPVIRAGPPSAGPVLAGARAVWAQDRRDGGFDVKSAKPGDAPALVFAVAPPPFSTLVPELSASAKRLVVAAINADRPQRDVYTAGVGKAPEQLDAGCDTAGQADLPTAVDVSGEAIVFPRCSGPGQFVHVRSYASSPPTDQVIPTAVPGGGLRIAGRYVAWLDNGGGSGANTAGVTVYDWVARAVVYRIKRADVGSGLYSLDLQTDGTLAFSYGSKGQERIAWASPAAPYRHTLPVHGLNPYEVRIASNRIAFEAGPQVNAGVVAPATVGLSDLAGHTELVGNLAEGNLLIDDFDFDGIRVAWWSYGCTHALIHVVDANGSPRRDPPRSGCQLRFRRQPRREDHGSRLHLFIDCFGFDSIGDVQCAARDVRVTARRGDKDVLVGAKHRGVRVKLTQEGRELLDRAGPLKVRITATLVDDAGRQERRSTSASLGE